MSEGIPNELEVHLKNLDRASDNASKAYLLYLDFISYCLLTIASTTDVQIVQKHAVVDLPIINVEIALSAFFILAPLMMLAVFLFLMIGVNRLFYLEQDLNEYEMKNNIEVKRRIYPWWAVAILKDKEPNALKQLQSWLGAFSIWWLLPITLFVSMLWTIKKHSWEFSYFSFVMFAAGLMFVLYFWNRYKVKTNRLEFIEYLGQDSRGAVISIIVLTFYLLISYILIPWAQEGASWVFRETNDENKKEASLLSTYNKLEK